MLNAEKSIQFVTLRDVILTVKSKLLGANLKDAMDWLRKNFYPVESIHLRRPSHAPLLFVYSGRTGYKLADNGTGNQLLLMAMKYSLFFNEQCYDTHAFEVEIINSYFSSKDIDISFMESDFCWQKYNEAIPALVDNREPAQDTTSRIYNQEILFLREFREDDPLALAIDIRNRDWSGYDPNEPESKSPKQESIITALQIMGFSKIQAKSIESVACPIKRK